MYKRPSLLFAFLLPALLTGCWSNNEIEDLALYTGLALDSGQPAPTEKEFEAKSSSYVKQNKVMATIQVVPTQSEGSKSKPEIEAPRSFQNVSGSGDSILEIFRQFSIRLDRPVIGHHLKVIVLSADLLKKQTIEQMSDFVLRDNDIRPSTMVFVTEGNARETLMSAKEKEVPSFHIVKMVRNQSRTSKVLDPVTLSRLDAMSHAKKSFVLQNIITGGGEMEFAGAGIIKGSTGHWAGKLNQEDTECLSWLRSEASNGVIKSYDRNNEPLTYELKSMKSKITPRVEGDRISFEVKISTEGRYSETWRAGGAPSSHAYAEKAGAILEERLAGMMQSLMRKLQKEYKTDVAGFGDQLAMEKPAVWNKVKDNWDEIFSRSKVKFTYDLKITDFGSFTEK